MEFSDGKRSYSLGHSEGLTPLQQQRFSRVAGFGNDQNNGADRNGSDVPLEQKFRPGASTNVWDYNEILDILGFGKVQWMLLMNSGLLTMTCMAAQLAVGLIAISSQCEFNMTQSDKGVMMASTCIGIVISTYICGYICDALGRRTVLMWSMFITNVLQLVTMFVCNIWVFNFVNFLMGLSLGGVTAAVYPYLGEFISNKYRAVAINYSTMFVSITTIYVPAVSWWVLSMEWSWKISDSFTFKPWRLIILLSLLPGLIGAIMLLFTPESPVFLLAQGKHEEAVLALNWVSRINAGINLELLLKTPYITLKHKELAGTDVIVAGRGCTFIANIWKATVPLFKKPHGVHVILAVVAMFGMLFSSNGMQIWFPEIVNRSASGSSSSTICAALEISYAKERMMAANMTGPVDVICDDTITTKTYIHNIIVGVAFLLGFSIQGVLLNPFGRKNVLIGALTVGAICGLLLQLITDTTGILILFCLYILLPGLSMSIMCGAAVDLVPTHLKGKSVSMGLTMSRLGVILSSNIIAAMLESYCSGLFTLVTVVIIVCASLVHFLPI